MLDLLKHPHSILQLVGSGFSHGWFYFPCALTVLGFWRFAIFAAFSGALGVIAMLCLLVARRRRAIVLQGIKRGFIVNNSKTAAGAGATQQNKNIDEQASEYAIITTVATLAPADKKSWPSGAARMFEGSDIFFDDIQTEDLWDFFFSSASGSQEKQKLQQQQQGSFVSDALHFCSEHLWTLIGDIGGFTGCVLDGYHCFAAVSCLTLVLLGVPDLTQLDASNKQAHAAGADDPTRKYFPTTAHALLGICIVAAIVGVAAAPSISQRYFGLEQRFFVTWLKIRFFAAVMLLLAFCGVRESLFARVFGNGNSIAETATVTTSSSSSSWRRHFPSNEELFRFFYAAPATDAEHHWDHLESDNLKLFRLAKRPLANPTACLLSKPASSLNNSSSSGKKKTNGAAVEGGIGEEEALDAENEHVRIGSFVPLAHQWLIASVCLMFSFFGEISGLKREPLQVPLSSTTPAVSSSSAVTTTTTTTTAAPVFAPSVLMKDSVSHLLSQYVSLIGVRVLCVVVFSVLAVMISPMMSWEMSFGSWLGTVYLKAKSVAAGVTEKNKNNNNSNTSLGLIDILLVTVCLSAVIFLTLQSVFNFHGRVTTHKKSFIRRHLWLRTAIVAAMACLLAANDTSFAMSATAVRGKGEHLHHHQQQQQDATSSATASSSSFSLLQAAFANTFQPSSSGLRQLGNNLLHVLHELFGCISLGNNPWSIVTKVYLIVGGVKCLLPCLLLYTRSEEALGRLGVPGAMIAVNGEALLLDNGRARMLGLLAAGAWTWYGVVTF